METSRPIHPKIWGSRVREKDSVFISRPTHVNRGLFSALIRHHQRNNKYMNKMCDSYAILNLMKILLMYLRMNRWPAFPW